MGECAAATLPAPCGKLAAQRITTVALGDLN